MIEKVHCFSQVAWEIKGKWAAATMGMRGAQTESLELARKKNWEYEEQIACIWGMDPGSWIGGLYTSSTSQHHLCT